MHTTEQIVALQPCYTEEEVAELVGDGITVQQIAALDISTDDKMWVLLKLLHLYGAAYHNG